MAVKAKKRPFSVLKAACAFLSLVHYVQYYILKFNIIGPYPRKGIPDRRKGHKGPNWGGMDSSKVRLQSEPNFSALLSKFGSRKQALRVSPTLARH